ncbi:MAG: MoxR family ATPase [Bacteroidetes bacterium]|nr:MoxR family ATPase [Bacteroidota bacterium]MBU2505669.1 MoxR family ATPase [Bacteroidota bacterium]
MNSELKNSSDVELVNELSSSIKQIKKEIAKIIVGQDDIIDNLLINIFAGGHSLLVGVPGLAKTLLIKTIADVLDLEFKRIQFTPDLMPGDITGTEILEENQSTKKREFRFIMGPIFANIILADEINRTPPKTQAALLEAMQEHKVTAAGVSYKLDEPFFVLATQNPIEQEGTYPLPEAQLDRFMFNLWLDYPSFEEELQIVKNTTSDMAPELSKILSKEQLLKFQKLVWRIPVADNVIEYAVGIVKNTRPSNSNSNKQINDWVNWGAGPRASQYLIISAKTRAIFNGRFTPNIDDVKASLLPVLRHRIIPNFNAEAEGITSIEIVDSLISAMK